ncbi:MAG: hypothetical protein AAF573_06675 [Bacteroidota bacterium]
MDSISFVKELRHFLDIDNDIDQYRKHLELSEMRDTTSIALLKLYESLDSESKKNFFEIIRQIKVDTTSLILGVLDGVMILKNQEADFILGIKGDKDLINGELQQIFLGFEEDDEWESYVPAVTKKPSKSLICRVVAS